MSEDTTKSDAVSEPADPADANATAPETAETLAGDDALPMPGGTASGTPTASAGADSADAENPEENPAEGELPPPPSFGRQMAQLVIIPAVIALSAIGLFAFFGSLANTQDKLEDQLIKLRQGSGYGSTLPAGVQDPRYKNRCLAAFNISQSIDQLEDPDKRRWLNDQLIDILAKNVHEHDNELINYLLIAIGRLGIERPAGESSGLEIITNHIKPDKVPPAAIAANSNSPAPVQQAQYDQINQGVLLAVMSWPNREAAATTIPDLIPLTTYTNPAIRKVAVTAIGVFADAGDTEVIDALHEALRSTDPMYYESRWQAANCLAILDQPEGVTYVLDILLNRSALAQLPEDPVVSTEKMMNERSQDRVMLATLAFAQRMTDEKVWARISELAENDPSVTIRKAAIQVMEDRAKKAKN